MFWRSSVLIATRLALAQRPNQFPLPEPLPHQVQQQPQEEAVVQYLIGVNAVDKVSVGLLHLVYSY